jgi:hypothetical protein
LPVAVNWSNCPGSTVAGLGVTSIVVSVRGAVVSLPQATTEMSANTAASERTMPRESRVVRDDARRAEVQD